MDKVTSKPVIMMRDYGAVNYAVVKHAVLTMYAGNEQIQCDDVEKTLRQKQMLLNIIQNI